MRTDCERVDWVVLTTGDRPTELAAALSSLRADDLSGRVVVVVNAVDVDVDIDMPEVIVVRPGRNLGVPGGRDLGLETLGSSGLVGFLDDDAVLLGGLDSVVGGFRGDDRLGAVALRVVDEFGETARRHVPKIGRRGAEEGGPVANFLGGACVMRRSAYLDAGGYFTRLHYGHEEIELSWRLADRGWRIRYEPGCVVQHPRTPISRHADGWRSTGRNRVLVARRTLPWPVAVVHVLTWLALGIVRAEGPGSRRAYVAGWFAGWRADVDRRPVSWRAVVALTRAGRPPVV